MRTSRRLSLVAVPVHSFHLCLILALIGSWSSLFGSSGSITFTWKTIGDPGNPGMPTRPHGQMSNVITIGQVNHEYAMAKHEVTAGQYAHFLNCKARFGDPTASTIQEQAPVRLATLPGLEVVYRPIHTSTRPNLDSPNSPSTLSASETHLDS